MKLRLATRRHRLGSTLLMVLVLSSATLMILGGVLSWTTTNTTLSGRNNEYFRTIAAAEAATEKVIAAIEYDYQTGGDTPVQNNLSSYRLKVPTVAENPKWGSYQFSNGQGNGGQTYAACTGPQEFRVLTAQYRGLYGYASVFRIISNAREATSRYNLTAGVWQDVETATIPLFQFAIFYNLDLEINPGPVMTVTGPVHSNQKVYLQPQNVLTFQGDVTAAGEIINNKKPGDPSVRSGGSIVFADEHDSGVSTLNLPIGTNNTAAAVRGVVEPPPVGESPTSPMGQQRFYNKADLIVTVTDLGINITSGIINNKGTIIDLSSVPAGQKWLDTSRTLYNKRENKTVREIEIDVDNLVEWNASTNNTLPVRAGSGGTKDVTIIYVDDRRTMSSSQQPGVLLRNGDCLPPLGLTVVTPEPLYVAGHYNVKDTPAGARYTGTADTTHSKPAALIGDSITILSTAWNASDPAYGSQAFSSRLASPTTVNAAILAGIVETVSGSYSGGVENFPRFLEDWNGDAFTYNGSMVVMYPSQIATGLWQGTGSTIGIYNPPDRNWAFDQNFRNPAKLPPGTPSVRALIRGAWAMVRPGTTDIVNPNEIIQ